MAFRKRMAAAMAVVTLTVTVGAVPSAELTPGDKNDSALPLPLVERVLYVSRPDGEGETIPYSLKPMSVDAFGDCWVVCKCVCSDVICALVCRIECRPTPWPCVTGEERDSQPEPQLCI